MYNEPADPAVNVAVAVDAPERVGAPEVGYTNDHARVLIVPSESESVAVNDTEALAETVWFDGIVTDGAMFEYGPGRPVESTPVRSRTSSIFTPPE